MIHIIRLCEVHLRWVIQQIARMGEGSSPAAGLRPILPTKEQQSRRVRGTRHRRSASVPRRGNGKMHLFGCVFPLAQCVNYMAIRRGVELGSLPVLIHTHINCDLL